MSDGRQLPEDGDLRLGDVAVLRGRRVRTIEGHGEPVAWVTYEPVPGAGRVWLALSEMAAETGLQPVLLVAPFWVPGYDPADYFVEPSDVTELDRMNAAGILAGLWDAKTADDDNPRVAGQHQHFPFSRRFPGLAPIADGQLAMAEILGVLDSLPDAHVCLAAAARPADVLAVTGWGPTDAWDSALPVAAVLRSWEDRFGASLLQLGPSAEIRLLVSRPPRTVAVAQLVAAEQWAFCGALVGAWVNQEHEFSVTTVREMASHIINQPVWGFWWD